MVRRSASRTLALVLLLVLLCAGPSGCKREPSSTSSSLASSTSSTSLVASTTVPVSGQDVLGRAVAWIEAEPTSGLDLRTSFLYREALTRLMQGGTTILLVTHHIHEIPAEVRRVVLLKQGRILADGNREDVLTSEALSALFDYPLHAVSHNGTCQVFPAARTPGNAHFPSSIESESVR